VLALVADVKFWGASLGNADVALLVSLTALPLAHLCLRSRRLQAIVTVAYALACVLSAWLLSPSAYS
jgi:hypothetical protein